MKIGGISQEQSKALVILGMHRSGTSTVAGVLRLCGAWLGNDEEMTGTNEENLKGFFERRDLRGICDRLLHSAAADWWRPSEFRREVVPDQVMREESERFRELVGCLSAHGTWAIKEPRLCLLFPLLQEAVSLPVFVLPIRNPVEVAKSLRTRNNFSVTQGIALWEIYVRRALAASEGGKRVFISYDDLVADPIRETKVLVETLQGFGAEGIRLPENVSEFVSPQLHRETADKTELDDLLDGDQRSLWESLLLGQNLVVEGRRELSGRSLLLLKDLEQQHGAFRENNQHVNRLRAQTRKLEARSSELTRKIGERGNRLSELKFKLKELEARSSEITREIGERGNRLSELKFKLKELEARSSEITREIGERGNRLSELKFKLKELEPRSSEITREIGERGKRLGELKLEVEELEARSSELTRSIGEREARLKEVNARVGDLENHREQSRERLQAILSSELEALQQQFVDARRRPLKSLWRKLVSELLYLLSKQEALLPNRRREKFKKSAQKRDPARNVVDGIKKRVLAQIEVPEPKRTPAQIGGPEEKSASGAHFHRGRRLCAAAASPVAVIVPVYNAAEDVEVCIMRLSAFTPSEVDILFIDDASTDPRISELLAEASERPGMRVLRNDQNCGFTGTVNRGLAQTAPRDVIVLNSDARVTPKWVEGICAAAFSAPRIATVTPMSDRAGAFSAPEIGDENPLPPGVDEITYARAFRRRGLGLYPVIPTGNGFCMFIRRACLDEIGMFDAKVFPRGYGEENDFCMRAGRAGWRHVIDDCTYIFHDRSKSFGEAKHDLMASGRAVVDARYPEYKKAIAVFRESPQIECARSQARLALADCASPDASLPRLLFVISTVTGGTPQTNRDLMGALSGAAVCFVLRCDSRKLELSEFSAGGDRLIREHVLEEPVDPITHDSAEYELVLADWLDALDLDLVHVRHPAWHGLSMARIAREQGRAVVISFHDYYTLCPTVKLVDETNTFCGGRCTAGAGDCRPELWPAGSLGRLKDSWVHVWRKRFGEALAGCDAFVTTSEAARARLLEHLPGLPEQRFRVIPHGRDFASLQSVRAIPTPSEPLRVLVPGNISEAKGLGVLHAILSNDRQGDFEFHVLGKCQKGRYPDHPRLIQHGPYARDEFAARAAEIRPHLGAVFSLWDETWCHTLTELWSISLPAAVFDFPTVAGRVRETGAGWVLDHRDIPELCCQLAQLGRDPAEIARTDAALSAWRAGQARAENTRWMAADYLDLYRDAFAHRRARADQTMAQGATSSRPTGTVVAAPRRPPRVAVVGVADPSQTRGSGSTEFRLWERTRNSVDRGLTFVRMSPEELLASLRCGRVDAAALPEDAVHEAFAEPLVAALGQAEIPWLLDIDVDHLKVPMEDPGGFDAAIGPNLRRLIAAAPLVTVSTEALRSKFSTTARRVELLPNYLSDRLWRGSHSERKKDTAIRALYLATDSHADDLALIFPALEAFARQERRFQLAVIGETGAVLPEWAERVDVPPDEQAYHRFVPWLRVQASAFDFALAPMENVTLNAFKSPRKLLESGALGIPVLASDRPAYREMAAEAPGVRLVRDDTSSWIKALAEQAAAGRVEGAELRAMILSRHALEPSLPRFDQLLTGMIS